MVETLQNKTVVSVSCGMHHTAALLDTGDMCVVVVVVVVVMMMMMMMMMMMTRTCVVLLV